MSAEAFNQQMRAMSKQDRLYFCDEMERVRASMFRIAAASLHTLDDVTAAVENTVMKAFIRHSISDEGFRVELFRLMISECELMKKNAMYSHEINQASPAVLTFDTNMHDTLVLMNESVRIVFILHFIEKLSLEEMAQVLQVSDEEVQQRKDRVLSELCTYADLGEHVSVERIDDVQDWIERRMSRPPHVFDKRIKNLLRHIEGRPSSRKWSIPLGGLVAAVILFVVLFVSSYDSFLDTVLDEDEEEAVMDSLEMNGSTLEIIDYAYDGVWLTLDYRVETDESFSFQTVDFRRDGEFMDVLFQLPRPEDQFEDTVTVYMPQTWSSDSFELSLHIDHFDGEDGNWVLSFTVDSSAAESYDLQQTAEFGETKVRLNQLFLLPQYAIIRYETEQPTDLYVNFHWSWFEWMHKEEEIFLDRVYPPPNISAEWRRNQSEEIIVFNIGDTGWTGSEITLSPELSSSLSNHSFPEWIDALLYRELSVEESHENFDSLPLTYDLQEMGEMQVLQFDETEAEVEVVVQLNDVPDVSDKVTFMEETLMITQQTASDSILIIGANEVEQMGQDPVQFAMRFPLMEEECCGLMVYEYKEIPEDFFEEMQIEIERP